MSLVIRRPSYSARVGSSIWKVEPLPTIDSTQMRPPCISTICLAMASPRPVPPLAFVLELSTWWNWSKMRVCCSSADSRTRVRHADGEMAVSRDGDDAHLAGVGELDGVADKVEEHLCETLLVAKADGQALATSVLRASFLVSASDSVAARTVSTTLSIAYSARFKQIAGLDLGDVEHSVNEAEEVLAIGADAGESVRRLSACGP